MHLLAQFEVALHFSADYIVFCSWILKTDYLTASNEAGRFLLEEPYEWHKKCLTEDGAINLEAPRKWRLVKERTGHGAFYGMRIIIYGECIAPPLVCFINCSLAKFITVFSIHLICGTVCPSLLLMRRARRGDTLF